MPALVKQEKNVGKPEILGTNRVLDFGRRLHKNLQIWMKNMYKSLCTVSCIL